jgi:magnesium-transporting ATPase (P-type)
VVEGPINPNNSTIVSGAEIIKQFFTFFLLNSSIIPVSLYVSVRLARTLQMVVMQWDREMFHDEPALFAASGGLEGE